MRVEFKVMQKGVKRRVSLTPASSLDDLGRAESILVTPHADE